MLLMYLYYYQLSGSYVNLSKINQFLLNIHISYRSRTANSSRITLNSFIIQKIRSINIKGIHGPSQTIKKNLQTCFVTLKLSITIQFQLYAFEIKKILRICKYLLRHTFHEKNQQKKDSLKAKRENQ